MTTWRGVLAGLLVGLAIGGSPALGQRSDAVPPTPIRGVWAFVSETNTETGARIRDDSTWSGIWVFTGRYHCLARMQNKRRALTPHDLEALPPAERVKYYEQLLNYSSTAGTYRVEGNTLHRTWDISQGPDIIGQSSVATFKVEGDLLFVDLPRRTADSGPAVQVVYRRLEQF